MIDDPQKLNFYHTCCFSSSPTDLGGSDWPKDPETPTQFFHRSHWLEDTTVEDVRFSVLTMADGGDFDASCLRLPFANEQRQLPITLLLIFCILLEQFQKHELFIQSSTAEDLFRGQATSFLCWYVQ